MHSPQTRLLIPLVVLLATFASPGDADADKKAKNRISAVSFDDAGQQTTIEIRGSSTPTFTVYKLERPTRVVVDIAGASLNDKVKDAQENGATMPVGTWAVNQLAAYELDDGGKLVRVVVTLARPGRYDVKSDGNDVVVTVIARDDAPEAVDAADVEAAQAAAEKAKKDSEEAKTARAKAEKDAAKAKGQADTSKKEADAARQALAEAQDAAAKADKKSKAEREKADKALAEAKAEAERTKKAASEAKAEADRTKKAVDDANARAEKTMKVAERAKAELETMKEELAAAKADAKRMKEEAVAAKADADAAKEEAHAAKADASAQRRKAGDAEKAAADAEKAAAAAEKAAATAKKEKADSEKAAASAAKASADDKKAAADAKKAAADAKKAAERLEAEAAEARAEAKRARAEAEAAQEAADEAKAQAAAAKKEAAAQKRDAEAAKAEAASQKKDAEAMRAEAERMLGEAKARLEDASTEAKAAKKSQEAAVAAQAKAEKKEEAARAAEAKAADERKAAKKDLADAEKARAAGDDDAEKRIADAEARLKKAEKARTTAEEQRRAAETSAEEARVLAERRKAETDDAVAAKAAAEKEKKAAAKAASEADQRAARAEALRKEEDTAAAAAAEAKAAGNRAEAKRLEKEAAQAKKAREQEESQLAAIVAERRAVEADLADARQDAEAARKDAEVARKDAAAAEKRAAQAKQEADAAEARAEAAKVELAKAEKAKKAIAKAEPPPAKKVEPAPAKAKAKAKAKAIAVSDVTFEQKGDDAKVIIEMSGEVEPEVKASGKRIEMTLAGVELPKKLERTLDVTRFDGAVRSVSSYRDGGKVRVVVDLSSEITPKVERSGTTVRMSFAGAGAVAKKPKKAKSKVKTESIPAPVVGGYGASSAPVTSKSVAQAGGSRRKVYRGPTIDLDFKDADIHNLLRFLANIGRVSIVVPDDIKATVTVRLKRVPWDQALEVILASKGLWYRKEGNLYRVAPRKVLDAEDQAEAERIRAAVQSEVPEAEVFTLNYASADETQEKLVPLLSPKGKIEVDSRTNSLIINDIRSHRRRVIDLAARLDTQTPQIMIEARIVEARSTYARDIGIQWGGAANASQAGGNATGLIFPNSIAVTGGNEDRQTPVGGVATPSDFAINLPAVTGTRAGAAFGISLGSVGGNFNLNLRLSAAEDTGTVRIVSSPKIMVLNNVEAEISQGQSIPISVVSAQGTQTQFVPAELSLKVTPYVSQRDCSIAMNVEVTKNEPDFVNTGARGDPTILTKEAKTRLLVADGETTVLGGITTRNSGIAYNKVPFFGDLPVFGWFFKRRVENDDRTELLIFITPRITNKAFLRCE